MKIFPKRSPKIRPPNFIIEKNPIKSLKTTLVTVYKALFKLNDVKYLYFTFHSFEILKITTPKDIIGTEKIHFSKRGSFNISAIFLLKRIINNEKIHNIKNDLIKIYAERFIEALLDFESNIPPSYAPLEITAIIGTNEVMIARSPNSEGEKILAKKG
tara:strand:+ start:1068 stop:1541 length:474 start_codon:yes stop_codon:yes gene_type:complete